MEIDAPPPPSGYAPDTKRSAVFHRVIRALRQNLSEGIAKSTLKGRSSWNGWTAMRAFSFLCVLLPLLALAGGVFSPPGAYWGYVRDHLLRAYFAETLLLTAGAGISTFLLGVSLAWVMSMYDFCGRKFFEVVLVLPLAIPPYLAAYAYEGLLGYTGMVQSFLRDSFNIRFVHLTMNIPAQGWAIWIFGVTLFPYVYLLTRAFLRNQSAALFENALLLGGGHSRMFFRVGLPLLLPAAASGVILVCLEVLNDFGVSSYYGLNTFTTAIFAAWFGMGDADAAVKLALILLALVFFVLLVRKATHNARRYHIVSSRERLMAPYRVAGLPQAGIVLLCAFACLAGFAAPLLQMLHWLWLSWDVAFTPDLGRALLYTLSVSGTATLAVMIAATATVNAGRLFTGKSSILFSQGATLGYAIPSAVLAIGIISFFTGADKFLAAFFPFLPDKFLSMGGLMLVFAYGIRFFTIGYQTVEAGFAKTGMVYTEASRTLGRNVTSTFFLVDLPLVRHALLSGSALVFIDILKELPLGLLLRPFNTETLGTAAYHFARNEVLEETALPSLCIILAGTAFILLMQFKEKKRPAHVPEN
ncbi:MAG: iron ABC transporter permease [Desulfovibrio sp.]|jgi:iron(III) transport system permease protein|nr:iron ABC transporter permease [Desulfovibrio sp.]